MSSSPEGWLRACKNLLIPCMIYAWTHVAATKCAQNIGEDKAHCFKWYHSVLNWRRWGIWLSFLSIGAGKALLSLACVALLHQPRRSIRDCQAWCMTVCSQREPIQAWERGGGGSPKMKVQTKQGRNAMFKVQTLYLAALNHYLFILAVLISRQYF